MKYHLLLLIFLLFPARAGLLRAQENHVAPPRHQQRLAGSATLSNGIFWSEKASEFPERFLRDFLEEQQIQVHPAAARKTITLEMRKNHLIRHIPENTKHGYSLRITPQRITIEYQTLQGAHMAVRQFTEYYLRNVTRKGSANKKILLPCCEIYGWLTDSEMVSFRWTGPQSTVPFGATCIEMMLTDPVNGWFGASEALSAVGYDTPLCKSGFATYADVETERRKLTGYGLEVIPVFDLSGENEPFESVTGHPMLSVEGMRFIQALLGSFLEYSETTVIAFIVPQGRYREQIRSFIGLYPQITDLRFLE